MPNSLEQAVTSRTDCTVVYTCSNRRPQFEPLARLAAAWEIVWRRKNSYEAAGRYAAESAERDATTYTT